MKNSFELSTFEDDNLQGENNHKPGTKQEKK